MLVFAPRKAGAAQARRPGTIIWPAINWAHGVNGDWTTGADWSGGVAPGALDSVTINAAGTYEVTLFTAAAAASLIINDAGATFYDAGSLGLTGTLALQAGTLALAYGAINGGTLALSGGTLLEGGGLLNKVAVQGTLDMSRSNSDLLVENGMLLSGAGGSGAGSVTLTGGYADLAFLGSQTLDHATISIGAIGVAPGQGGAATLGITHLSGATTGATLTLGAGLWLHDIGGQAELAVGNTGILQGPVLPDALINLGTITANSAGGTLTVAGSGSFTNQGTIAVTNGATLDIASAGFTNSGLISLNGGTLDLGGIFSSLRLSQLGNLQLSQATIDIVGTADNTGNNADRWIGLLDRAGRTRGHHPQRHRAGYGWRPQLRARHRHPGRRHLPGRVVTFDSGRCGDADRQCPCHRGWRRHRGNRGYRGR